MSLNAKRSIAGYDHLSPVPRGSLTKPSVAGNLHVAPLTTQEQGEQLHAVSFSPDGLYLAAGFGNGAVEILDASASDFPMLQRQRLGPPCDGLPTTSVKWRVPLDAETHLLASTSSEGTLFLWKVRHGGGFAVSEKLHRFHEDGNELNVCDFCPDGSVLATAGSDRVVRTYDPVAGKHVANLTRGYDADGHGRPAHSNRIFALRFATNATLLSGGWESPLQVWDLRTGRAERQIGGTHIGSDGIEVLHGGSHALVANHRDNHQIMMIDFIAGREVEAVSSKLTSVFGKSPVLALRAHVESDTLWALTAQPAGVQHLKLSSGEVTGVIEDLDRGFNTLDIHPHNPRRCAFGGMCDALLVVDAHL